nr:putative integron gene cassette protein [uncultured bacterium]
MISSVRRHTMEIQQVDKFILASVNSNWQKIAMVIAKALTAPDIGSPDDQYDAEFIASRVEALIGKGELEIQGRSNNWRHSEVRLKSHSSGVA